MGSKSLKKNTRIHTHIPVSFFMTYFKERFSRTGQDRTGQDVKKWSRDIDEGFAVIAFSSACGVLKAVMVGLNSVVHAATRRCMWCKGIAGLTCWMIYKGQCWHDYIAMNALHMLFVNCNMLLNDTDLILLNINPWNWNDLSNAHCFVSVYFKGWTVHSDHLWLRVNTKYHVLELGHRIKRE